MQLGVPHPHNGASPFGRMAGALPALLALLLMGAFLAGLWLLRQEDLVREQNSMERLAVSLAEQSGLALREMDLVLRETRADLEPAPTRMPQQLLHTMLHERIQGLAQGQALMAFSASGRMLGHSRVFPTPDVHIEDREYFKAHLAGRDALYISQPLRNRVNKRWMISLSRPLRDGNGAFAGVIMAAVEMDYFANLFDSLHLPLGAVLELRRADGVLLAAHPFDEARLAAGPGQKPAAAPGENIAVTRTVPGLGLTVHLSIPADVALRQWHRHTLVAALGMLAMLAALAAFATMRRAHLRELKERNQRLQSSEAALRASEARYRSIVETASEGICAFDAQGRITYANEVLAELLGMRAEALPGSHLADVLPLPCGRAEGDELTRWLDTCRETQELRLRVDAGQEVWAMVSLGWRRADDGGLDGGIAMLTDISRRKEEERFRQSIEGILRHDLRSPLAALVEVPGLMLAGDNLDEQQRLVMDETRRCVRKMLRMVDAYLRLGSMERGALALERQPVDLIELLDAAAQELLPRFATQGKTLRVSLDGEAPGPGAAVPLEGEGVLLETMLVNLLKNALEASPPKGEVRVDVGRGPDGLDIRVWNLGAVPEAIRGRFFGKYVTAGKSKGTGLGAYSARLIAEAHGGSVRLDADEPGATTVCVRLPLLS